MLNLNMKKEPLESEIAKIKNRGNIILPGKITEYDSWLDKNTTNLR